MSLFNSTTTRLPELSMHRRSMYLSNAVLTCSPIKSKSGHSTDMSCTIHFSIRSSRFSLVRLISVSLSSAPTSHTRTSSAIHHLSVSYIFNGPAHTTCGFTARGHRLDCHDQAVSDSRHESAVRIRPPQGCRGEAPKLP